MSEISHNNVILFIIYCFSFKKNVLNDEVMPSMLQLYAQFSTNVTDKYGNGACVIKTTTNLFKNAVLQIK